MFQDVCRGADVQMQIGIGATLITHGLRSVCIEGNRSVTQWDVDRQFLRASFFELRFVCRRVLFETLEEMFKAACHLAVNRRRSYQISGRHLVRTNAKTGVYGEPSTPTIMFV